MEREIQTDSLGYHLRHSPATVVLVAVNLLVFGLCWFFGSTLYPRGAMITRSVLSGGQWYRLVSSMFLHADLEHLITNMIALYLAGGVVEQNTGSARFLLLYFVSGIGGNLLSMAVELHTGGSSFSVGASGAIFGVLAAVVLLVARFYVLARRQGRMLGKSLGVRTLIMLLYSVYSGFVNPQVNAWAHLGGLLSGLVLSLFLILPLRRLDLHGLG